MALDYKSSLSRYRRYLQVVQKQPMIRASLWVIFSLVLTISMILTALNPTLKTIAGLIGQIEQEEKVSEQLDDKIRTVQQAAENFEKVRDKFVFLDQAIPMEPEWRILAERLEEAASESKLNLQNVTVERIPMKGVYINEKTTTLTELKAPQPVGANLLPISISAVGEYLQIREFISKMEMMRRVISITSINIQKNSTGVITVNIEGWAVFTDMSVLEL